MNKLQKVLSNLWEQDLLLERRPSRLAEHTGYAIDMNAILNPTVEQAAQLEYWFDQLNQAFEESDFEAETYWENEGPSATGLLTLAWYQPLSFYQDQAGIFITDYGIWKYASGIRRGEGLEDTLFHDPDPITIPANICIALAVEVLLLHETFHHDVEWFTLKLATIHREHFLYRKYDEEVYSQSQKLEEALASARMQVGLNTPQNRHRFEIIWKQAVDLMAARAHAQPIGYKDANSYNSPAKHSLGRRALAASINQLDPNPKIIPIGPTLNIGKGFLSDYFRDNFTLVPIGGKNGSVAPPKSMAYAMPSKDIRRLLARRGYRKTGLGKGSHEVWTHDLLPGVTLPERKEFEGYQVLTSIRDALGYGSLDELREAAKRA